MGIAVRLRARFVFTATPRFLISGRSNSRVFSATSFKETIFNCNGAGRMACKNCVTM